MLRTIRIRSPSTGDGVAGLARGARNVLQRLAGGDAHLERLTGFEPFELQLGPHPRHRAAEGADVE